MADFFRVADVAEVPHPGRLLVEVEGEVLGAHARVRVRQRYCNESRAAVEAVYTFPLPADATLTAFAMTCAGRRMEGAVKEREAAFRQYDDAVVAGHGAALLEQERPDVFTATVGNLLPGCEADFVVLNPQATPLLARRTTQTETLAEWLFAMIVLGDERLIAHTVVQGQAVTDNGA